MRKNALLLLENEQKLNKERIVNGQKEKREKGNFEKLGKEKEKEKRKEKGKNNKRRDNRI